MARIRTIKPEFFTSEDICELSAFARLLYIALWCEADREGRLTWKPKTFKLRYFPGDSIDIDALCSEILERGLVQLYGEGFAFIPQFLKHQHINPRESTSTLPDPNAPPRVSDASARVFAPSVTHREERKGKEGKGKIEELPTSSDEKAPSSKPDEPPDPVWHSGLQYLVANGTPEKAARSFLGQLLKALGDDKLAAAEILGVAESQQVAEPLAWLRAAANARRASRASRPVVVMREEVPKASHRPLGEVLAEQDELFRQRRVMQ